MFSGGCLSSFLILEGTQLNLEAFILQDSDGSQDTALETSNLHLQSDFQGHDACLERLNFLKYRDVSTQNPLWLSTHSDTTSFLQSIY